MRWVLIREACVEAWKQRISTILVMVVTALTCMAVLLVFGQGAAQVKRLNDDLDSQGVRLFTVTQQHGDPAITAQTMAAIRATSSVETAVAVSGVSDVTNARIPGGQRVPMWTVDDPSRIIDAPNLRPGTAAVSSRSQALLGLEIASGAVVDSVGIQTVDVVSPFVPRPGFERLADGVVAAGPPVDSELNTQAAGSDHQEGLYRQVWVIVDDVTHLEGAQRAVASILGADANPGNFRISTALGLAEISSRFSGNAAEHNRTLLLVMLAAGAAFTAIVALADVLLRRKSLGRRRALGARRSDIVVLCSWRIAVPAAVGVVIGTAVTALYSAFALEAIPLSYVCAIGILVELAAACASIPPALWAAYRDPVSVLRSP